MSTDGRAQFGWVVTRPLNDPQHTAAVVARAKRRGALPKESAARRESRARYEASPKAKARRARYEESDGGRATRAKYEEHRQADPVLRFERMRYKMFYDMRRRSQARLVERDALYA